MSACNRALLGDERSPRRWRRRIERNNEAELHHVVLPREGIVERGRCRRRVERRVLPSRVLIFEEERHRMAKALQERRLPRTTEAHRCTGDPSRLRT